MLDRESIAIEWFI